LTAGIISRVTVLAALSINLSLSNREYQQMKRLLWSMSLACFLPAVAGLPAQAKNTGNVAFEANARELTNGFATNTEVAPSTNGWSVANVAGHLDSNISPAEQQSNAAGSLDTTVLAATKNSKSFASQHPVAAALPLSMAINQNPSAPEPVQPVQPSAPDLTQPAQPVAVPQKLADACNCTSTEDTTDLNNQLDGLRNQQFPINTPGNGGFTMSPAISINNPVGFGADKGVGFLTGSYQSRTRFTQKSDGELGIGVGLFDAVEAVGLELSYTINSFGTSQGFGSGGFNAKLHKRFGDAGVAVGWNRFANVTFGNTGVESDYPKNSYYAVATQVIRNGDDIDSFLSRIALSAGVGGGQFLSQDTLNNTPAGQSPSGVNAFGSAAFRLAKPLSAIVEWTGQDLAAGLSITPFDGFPLVITPAFRDISGINGESARFVLGVGTAWQF
jgi:hypothetical protein